MVGGLLLSGQAANAQPVSAAAAAGMTNVREFGAVGDGVADDTAAIQAAIDSGRGWLLFPKGNYRITQTLEVDLEQVGSVALSGGGVAKLEAHCQGPALRIRGTHQRSAAPEHVTDAVWQSQRMPTIDGLAIEGHHDEASGIQAVGTMQLTVTRLHLRSLLHGIHLVGNNRNVIVSDCHIYHNRGIGIFYDDVNLHQSNITGCHISYCGGGGIVSVKGNVRNLHITGCDIESNMSAGGPATANVLIDCRDSTAGTAEVAITGCTIQHNRNGTDSANIRIIGNSLPSQRHGAIREGHVTITGNILSDVQTNLHLQECRGVTVSGNTVWEGYNHNMLLQSCSNIVMSANNFDRNPRYDLGGQLPINAIVFRDCEDCTVTGLHVSQVSAAEAAVVLENCRRFNLSELTILDSYPIGLLLRDVARSRISGCLIRNDRFQPSDQTADPPQSIRVEGAEGVVIGNSLLDRPITGDSTGLVQHSNTIDSP